MASQAVSNVPLKLLDYSAFLGTVAREDNGNFTARNVLLIKSTDPESVTAITAESASYKGGIWTIEKGILRQFKGEDLISVKPDQSFKFNQKVNLLDIFQIPAQEEKSSKELWDLMKTEKAQGGTGRAYEINFHTHFSVPAACVIFFYVSPIFAIIFSRSGGFAGVLLSVFLVMFYYNAYVISKDILGKVDTIPAWLAAWLPNILFLFCGVIAARRLE